MTFYAFQFSEMILKLIDHSDNTFACSKGLLRVYIQEAQWLVGHFKRFSNCSFMVLKPSFCHN